MKYEWSILKYIHAILESWIQLKLKFSIEVFNSSFQLKFSFEIFNSSFQVFNWSFQLKYSSLRNQERWTEWGCFDSVMSGVGVSEGARKAWWRALDWVRVLWKWRVVDLKSWRLELKTWTSVEELKNGRLELKTSIEDFKWTRIFQLNSTFKLDTTGGKSGLVDKFVEKWIYLKLFFRWC
jgi:hypothetical protein